jgi:predicted DCC family thiol-disulfide oxidoreductase YuxK
MVVSTTQPSPPGPAAHLLLYDGVCGLCSRLVHFVLLHDRRGVFNFAPLQGALARPLILRAGGNPDELTSFYVFADYRTPAGRVMRRGRAALFIAGELGWPWKALRVMGVLPTGLLDRMYDVVARHRYQVFGRSEQCLVPPPEFRNRFID